jgi:colicin import membrane protein
MNDFVRRLFNSDEKSRDGSETDTPAAAEPEAVPASSQPERLAPYSLRTEGRSATVSHPEQPAPEPETGESEAVATGPENYAQVGEEVASVLSSAQQAAEQIRTAAEEEAKRITVEANEQARVTVTDAMRKAKQRDTESEQLRAEADKYGKETREAADRDAAELRRKVQEETAQKRAQVERELRELRRHTQQRAKEIEAGAHARQRALVQEAARTEERLLQLADVFRRMTGQLEELVPGRSERSSETEGEQPAEQLILEALKPGTPSNAA